MMRIAHRIALVLLVPATVIGCGAGADAGADAAANAEAGAAALDSNGLPNGNEPWNPSDAEGTGELLSRDYVERWAQATRDAHRKAGTDVRTTFSPSGGRNVGFDFMSLGEGTGIDPIQYTNITRMLGLFVVADAPLRDALAEDIPDDVRAHNTRFVQENRAWLETQLRPFGYPPAG